MKGLSRLELKYGRYAIRNLTLYIAVANIAIVFISQLIFGGKEYSAISAFALIPELVLKGQIWRLVTFIFLPDNFSFVWIFFTAYLTYMIGQSLELYWGRFKLNVYFFTGMLGSIIAAFISGAGTTGYYLNLSLFLAYATLFPNQEFLLFFMLPVKVKWLGIIDAAFLILSLFNYIRAGIWHMAAAIIVSFINYFIFFGDDFIKWIKLKYQVAQNRKRFFDQVRPYNRDRRF